MMFVLYKARWFHFIKVCVLPVLLVYSVLLNDVNGLIVDYWDFTLNACELNGN